MPKNVIILTWGTTGSSALCQLLRNCGYWCGDNTIKKTAYDTHENARLVALNKKLLTSIGYEGGYESRFDIDGIDSVRANAKSNPAPPDLPAFVETCNDHGPWLWKDPRLALTLDHWAPFIDIEQTRYIILTREPLQMWIASQHRRHIQHYSACRRTLIDYEQYFTQRVMELGAPHLRLTFEDMKRQPVTMSRKVLDFLDFPQSENKRILERNIPDYGARYNMFDFTHAALVYTKNTVWKGSRK